MYIKGIAYFYGKKAFEKGLPCVPAYDEKFLNDVLTGLKVGEGGAEYLKEWIKGWTETNLAS